MNVMDKTSTDKRLDEFREDAKERFGLVDQRFDRVEGQIQGLSGRLDSMNDRIDSMSGRLDSMYRAIVGAGVAIVIAVAGASHF
jgi:chromosome segregation ATPase